MVGKSTDEIEKISHFVLCFTNDALLYRWKRRF